MKNIKELKKQVQQLREYIEILSEIDETSSSIPPQKPQTEGNLPQDILNKLYTIENPGYNYYFYRGRAYKKDDSNHWQDVTGDIDKLSDSWLSGNAQSKAKNAMTASNDPKASDHILNIDRRYVARDPSRESPTARRDPETGEYPTTPSTEPTAPTTPPTTPGVGGKPTTGNIPMSAAEFQKLNSHIRDINRIKPGDVINFPASKDGRHRTHTVVPGETVGKILKQSGYQLTGATKPTPTAKPTARPPQTGARSTKPQPQLPPIDLVSRDRANIPPESLPSAYRSQAPSYPQTPSIPTQSKPYYPPYGFNDKMSSYVDYERERMGLQEQQRNYHHYAHMMSPEDQKIAHEMIKSGNCSGPNASSLKNKYGFVCPGTSTKPETPSSGGAGFSGKSRFASDPRFAKITDNNDLNTIGGLQKQLDQGFITMDSISPQIVKLAAKYGYQFQPPAVKESVYKDMDILNSIKRLAGLS